MPLIDALKITINASAHGVIIDSMMEFIHWFMLLLFIGWGLFIAYCIYAFNAKRHPKANYFGVRSKVSTRLEIGVIATEVVLLLAFAFPLWAQRQGDIPLDDPKAVHVRVVGERFLWNFHYAGADNKFGICEPQFISGSNPVGKNPDDPNGKDDFVVQGTMKAVVGCPVIVDVTAKDVIHNYAVPAMRIAQDAMPGTQVRVWYEPIKTGTYEIVCGQLCGAGHFAMRGAVEIVSQEEFNAWKKSSAPVAPVASAAPAPSGSAPQLALH